ncbi:methyltransferase type 11 [Micromonospora sp. ATCC 39149]|uniref:Methyltransferase domain-containing protein n=1 Tax=Micromonospora carbonacea TaxID=47853 RepID=A0A7D5YAP8_9ACTN|nr:class I SAM-dependent methyltransferase [Micromonospora sp. ATCC 39149]EEP73623.1 methyltransferase type 11 [Micromonospora sp. ATCC 39149]QLJ99540.1 methyltransferase domain-containing protein [Micromonospora carbonacea]
MVSGAAMAAEPGRDGATTAVKYQVAEAYDRVADAFADDPLTTPVARRLIDFVGLTAGQRVLDIGCGRGAVLLQAAAVVGPTGRAVGVDLAPRMVEHTARDVAARGLAHVEVRLADGEHLDESPRSYDVVLASMVMHAMDDPAGALRAYRTLLRPGGRVGIAEFAGADERWAAAMSVLAQFIDPQALPRQTAMPAGAVLLSSTQGVLDALGEAGFGEAEVVEVTQEVPFDSPRQWWEWTERHGVASFVALIPDARRVAAEDAVSRELDALRDADGRLVYRLPIRLARATAPIAGTTT